MAVVLLLKIIVHLTNTYIAHLAVSP